MTKRRVLVLRQTRRIILYKYQWIFLGLITMWLLSFGDTRYTHKLSQPKTTEKDVFQSVSKGVIKVKGTSCATLTIRGMIDEFLPSWTHIFRQVWVKIAWFSTCLEARSHFDSLTSHPAGPWTLWTLTNYNDNRGHAAGGSLWMNWPQWPQHTRLADHLAVLTAKSRHGWQTLIVTSRILNPGYWWGETNGANKTKVYVYEILTLSLPVQSFRNRRMFAGIILKVACSQKLP
jgi:hypothetical protein